MIVPLIAGLLLTVAGQDATTQQGTDNPPANGSQSTSDQSGNGGPTHGRAPDADAEDQGEVCRRVVSYDDFGRQRSRRICRPR